MRERDRVRHAKAAQECLDLGDLQGVAKAVAELAVPAPQPQRRVVLPDAIDVSIVPQPEDCTVERWDPNNPDAGFRMMCVRAWFRHRHGISGRLSMAETYMALAWLADPRTATVEPCSATWLGEIVGIDKRTAQRHMEGLEVEHQIIWERPAGRAPGHVVVPDYLSFMRLSQPVLVTWAQAINSGDVLLEAVREKRKTTTTTTVEEERTTFRVYPQGSR